MTYYFCDGDTKLMSFEEDPLINVNAVSQHYDLDEGWVSNGELRMGGTLHGGDWDEIPKDYVPRQIERMREARNSAPVADVARIDSQ